jgi:hypothetical protein
VWFEIQYFAPLKMKIITHMIYLPHATQNKEQWRGEPLANFVKIVVEGRKPLAIRPNTN